MVWLVIALLIGLGLFLYFKFFKIIKLKNILFIDGGLGTGKSFLSVSLAIRVYKRNLRRYKFQRFICSLLSFIPKFKKKYQSLEEPMLYSNIPLRYVKHSPLTLDLLLRKTRFRYNSVVFLDECSICFDQFDYKDRFISESLRDFFKLFRHEVGNRSFLVVNSQSTADLHYSLKSVLSDYLYIHHRTKLPFVSVLKVREMQYSSDKDASHIVNNESEDVESNLRAMVVLNKYFRLYDNTCYSLLTDGNPIEENYIVLDKSDSLKTEKVLTFKKERYKVK